MRPIRTALMWGVLALGAAATATAHHSFTAAFDMTKPVTVKGTIALIRLENPHSWFFIDVKDDSGSVQKWTVGGPSVTRMANNGWDDHTLKPGDTITAMGYRFSDGQPILRLEKIVMASGKEMFLYGRR